MDNLTLGPRGIALIQSFETLQLKAYHGEADPAGVWTIGWGHTKGVKQGDSIRLAQATALFREDTRWAQDWVNARLKSTTTQAQFDAMVSLTFNIGKGGFQSSTVLRLHNMNWDFGACTAILMWHWSAGKRRRGLLRRRCQETALYCEDYWGEAEG